MLALVLSLLALQVDVAGDRPRVRDLGIEPGILVPGSYNAITDVAGVRVGHVTLVTGSSVRTGVTAVLPHGGNLFQEKVPAAVHVANAFGKAAGFLQVQELGTLETPLILTNTLNVGTAVEPVVRWTLAQPGNEEVGSVNAVVGETNDGYLNDIRGQHVRGKDVVRAIEEAREGPVAEGSVGAGTGTRALGFKAGIGTSSRRLPPSLGGHTIGALVQSNFGGIFTLDGIPVGERLGRYSFRRQLTTAPPTGTEGDEERAGGSGDFVVAFSTGGRVPYTSRTSAEGGAKREALPDEALDPIFLATVEAVEEAIYNSILTATTMTGRLGRTVEALPLGELRELLASRAQ